MPGTADAGRRQKDIGMKPLDRVIGGPMGGAGTSSPIGGVLSGLPGGGRVSGGGGGLGGFLARFERAGLGHVAQSWVSNGPNQPVCPQRSQDVFGADRVRAMASRVGMHPQDSLARLGRHLPAVVHGTTPDGRVPDEGTMSV